VRLSSEAGEVPGLAPPAQQQLAAEYTVRRVRAVSTGSGGGSARPWSASSGRGTALSGRLTAQQIDGWAEQALAYAQPISSVAQRGAARTMLQPYVAAMPVAQKHAQHAPAAKRAHDSPYDLYMSVED
jgi:hypothetical protein